MDTPMTSVLELTADEWTAAREVALWYLANTDAAVVPRRKTSPDPALVAERELCERIVEATSQTRPLARLEQAGVPSGQAGNR